MFNRNRDLDRLPKDLEGLVKDSDVTMFNGFIFDEFSPNCVESVISSAHANGTQVFFDPGPRTVRNPN